VSGAYNEGFTGAGYQGTGQKMQVILPTRIKKELWRFGDRLFYPKGVTDPDYCVLKFTATSGRYYCDLNTESFKIEK